VEEAVRQIAEVKELYQKEERYRNLLDYSMTLEGLSRHSSVHAAGVVIAPGPLDEYVPVCTQSTKGSGERREQVIVTQYDMNCLEKAGMLKMDFLGLKTLTVIHDAWSRSGRGTATLRHPETGQVFSRAEEIPLDDPGVYRMLARGGTSGVFQFESALATEKLRAMKADRFDDLIATNALIRPGPLDMGMDQVYIRRKLGQEAVRYAHPELEEVLEPTYGVIVYQEQVMRIAQILSGFSLAEADVLRKAVGKKDAELIAKELGKFVEKAVAKGHDGRHPGPGGPDRGVRPVRLQQVALRGVRAALLPDGLAQGALPGRVHGRADLLRGGQGGGRGRLHRGLPRAGQVPAGDVPGRAGGAAAARERVEPEVHGGRRGRRLDPLRARRDPRRGRGRGPLDHRGARGGGPFASMFDLLTRIDLRLCNKRVLEALICGGALDGFAGDGGRAQLLAGLDACFAAAQDVQRERESSQGGLFDLMQEETGGSAVIQEPPPRRPRLDRIGAAAARKGDPRLLHLRSPAGQVPGGDALFDRVNTANLKEHRDQKVELVCVVTEVARQISKRDGAEWGRITVEDFHGTATVLAFGDAWANNRDALVKDAPRCSCAAASPAASATRRTRPIFLDGVVPLDSLRDEGQIGHLHRARRRRSRAGAAGDGEAAVRGAPGPRAGHGPLARRAGQRRRPGHGIGRRAPAPALPIAARHREAGTRREAARGARRIRGEAGEGVRVLL
jgi:DNA polymerase III subunit alpha